MAGDADCNGHTAPSSRSTKSMSARRHPCTTWQSDDERCHGELELSAHRPHALGFEVHQRGVVREATADPASHSCTSRLGLRSRGRGHQERTGFAVVRGVGGLRGQGISIRNRVPRSARPRSRSLRRGRKHRCRSVSCVWRHRFPLPRRDPRGWSREPCDAVRCTGGSWATRE